MRELIVITLILALTPNLEAQKGYQIGDEIGSFKLMNAANTINGVAMQVSLEDYNNVKGYIVVFTSNECWASRVYEDRIIALHRKYVMKGYPVIAINSNDAALVPEDSYDNMKRIAKDKNYPFAYLYDKSQQVALDFGATYTPQVFVIQKKKDKNIVRYIGAIDDNIANANMVKEKHLIDTVDGLLKGELPIRKIIPNTGCVIEWTIGNDSEISTADTMTNPKKHKK